MSLLIGLVPFSLLQVSNHSLKGFYSLVTLFIPDLIHLNCRICSFVLKGGVSEGKLRKESTLEVVRVFWSSSLVI